MCKLFQGISGEKYLTASIQKQSYKTTEFERVNIYIYMLYFDEMMMIST